MSDLKDGYCWCDMCGFNGKLPAKFRAEVEDSYACPWCKEAGPQFSLLCVGDKLEDHVIPDDPMMIWPEIDPRAVWFASHPVSSEQYECPVCGPQEKPCAEMAAELNNALYPTLSGFADWYALHGIPLGIGRENACVIYDAAVNDFSERSDRWFRAIQKELETVKAAFNEVEGQRNSLVIEVGNLRRVIADHLDSAQTLVGDELPIYCDCGHRKEKHDSSMGRCRAAGCDCTAMLQWRTR